MGVEKIHIGVAVDIDSHRKLVALADNRKMSMSDLVRALLEWAGERDGPTLARVGVCVPLWPHEFDSFAAGNTQAGGTSSRG